MTSTRLVITFDRYFYNKSEEELSKWVFFKSNLELGGESFLDNENELINFRGAFDKCKIESNKNLPFLNRAEGGFGGNINLTDKQLRVNTNYNKNVFQISFDVCNPDDGINLWTTEELMDIGKSMCLYLEDFFKVNITFAIELSIDEDYE